MTASFFTAEVNFCCPAHGYPQGQEGYECKTPFNLRWHFAFRHPLDEVVIRGECLLRCLLCGMLSGARPWAPPA